MYFWCPQCKNIERKIIVEFQRKSSALEVHGNTAKVKKSYVSHYCSNCNSDLSDTIAEDTICKKCHNGTLSFSQEITN